MPPPTRTRPTRPVVRTPRAVPVKLPDTQYSADNTPFTAVIFVDGENERYYDQAFDAARMQELPFKKIVRAKLDGAPIQVWKRLLHNIETDWVFRVEADVALHASATLTLVPFISHPDAGVFLVSVENDLMTNRFYQRVWSHSVQVFRTDALRRIVDAHPEAKKTDPMRLMHLTGYRVGAPWERARERQPDKHKAVFTEPSRPIVGKSLAVWSAWAAYRWCYALGADLRASGLPNDPWAVELALEGLAKSKHPEKLVAVAGLIAGIHDESDKGVHDKPSQVKIKKLFNASNFLGNIKRKRGPGNA